jgi:hypothetical protein
MQGKFHFWKGRTKGKRSNKEYTESTEKSEYTEIATGKIF